MVKALTHKWWHACNAFGPILSPHPWWVLVTYFLYGLSFKYPFGSSGFICESWDYTDNYTRRAGDKFDFEKLCVLALALCCFCFWLDPIVIARNIYFTNRNVVRGGGMA